MKIGTKSVLYGAHCFFIHPIFVFIAWWKLYGFPFDLRLWIAFIVHDIGYLGKPNMDGKEGETHVELGAKIMSIFDFGTEKWEYFEWRFADKGVWFRDGHITDEFNKMRKDGWILYGWGAEMVLLSRPVKGSKWSDLSKYHSRFYAKKDGRIPSKLCMADKLAICYDPTWFYLLRVNMTGEVKEYMKDSRIRERKEPLINQREWIGRVKKYMKDYVNEHKDGKPDTWTPENKEAINDAGVWK